MRKFLGKTLILLTILGILLAGVNFAYVHTEYYKNLNEMRKFYEIPDHIDIVNFGASHSQGAFNWEAYDSFSGVNMALGSQTIVYDRAFFLYYLDHLDENSTVVLEVMFKSLYEEEPEEGPFRTGITRYYKILSKDYIRQWNWKDALKFQYIPILGNRREALPHIWSEWVEGAQEEKELSSETLTGEPTQVLEGWEEEAMLDEGEQRASYFMRVSGSQEHGVQYEAFIDIIETCKEKHIQVILVTAPTLPCFYNSFSEEFMERFYTDIEEICEKYDLLYLDYTGDERFLKDYRWYRDTDHLNAYGADVFTQAFLQDVQELLPFYGE